MDFLQNILFPEPKCKNSALKQGQLADSYRDFYLQQNPLTEGYSEHDGHLTKSEMAFQRKLQEYATLYKINSDAYLNPRLQRPADEEVTRSLKMLNLQLVALAQKISYEMNHVALERPDLQDSIQKEQQKMQMYIDSLHTDRDELSTISGLQEHTKLVVESTYYHYIAWFLLTFTVVLAILLGAPLFVLILLLFFLIIINFF
jgi:hypothetical protein